MKFYMFLLCLLVLHCGGEKTERSDDSPPNASVKATDDEPTDDKPTTELPKYPVVTEELLEPVTDLECGDDPPEGQFFDADKSVVCNVQTKDKKTVVICRGIIRFDLPSGTETMAACPTIAPDTSLQWYKPQFPTGEDHAFECAITKDHLSIGCGGELTTSTTADFHIGLIKDGIEKRISVLNVDMPADDVNHFSE